MTTGSLLNIGSRALGAAQGSLATISHNIANASTAGYSRQEAQLATAGAQYTGAGFFGRGVDLAGVRRSYDQFLTGAVQSSVSAGAADSARASGLQALDSLFGDGELGIGAALDGFFSSAGDLANRPADLSSRQVFVAGAAALADRIAGVGAQIAQFSREADGRLVHQAAQANTHLQEIARFNEGIAQAQGSGHAPNDLLDRRDAAVQALGALLAVHPVAQDDGSVALFTPDGAPLLVGRQQARLVAEPDPDDATRHALRIDAGAESRWLDAEDLGGGALAGLLRLRDQDLTAAANQVGHIATVLASAANAQQALGVDMDGQPGAPLFRLPAPQSVPASGNAGSATLGVTVADAGALRPSDYEVRWDGAAYQVTRLADQQVSAVASLPTTIDGLRFAAAGAPAAGDRWQVRPFAAAGAGIAAQPLAPRQVATGYAATVQPAAGNSGKVAASDFRIAVAGPDNKLPVTITFNTPPTSYRVTGLAGGDLAAVPYSPGARVPAAPSDYNGWSFRMDGSPVAGDSFSVTPTANPAADNRNALALADIGRAAVAGGATLNEAYAALLGDVGSRTQTAQAAADVSARLQEEAVSRQQNVAGVDLDEEAANLLRFQQAYQAAARVIQASQSLFESLLAAAGR